MKKSCFAFNTNELKRLLQDLKWSQIFSLKMFVFSIVVAQSAFLVKNLFAMYFISVSQARLVVVEKAFLIVVETICC